MTTTNSGSLMPTLFKGDYYTRQEYDQLQILISKDCTLRYLLLQKALEERTPEWIKRSICEIDLPYKYSLRELIYNTPLSNVPMFLNEDGLTMICQWRLQINK